MLNESADLKTNKRNIFIEKDNKRNPCNKNGSCIQVNINIHADKPDE